MTQLAEELLKVMVGVGGGVSIYVFHPNTISLALNPKENVFSYTYSHIHSL